MTTESFYETCIRLRHILAEEGAVGRVTALADSAGGGDEQ